MPSSAGDVAQFGAFDACLIVTIDRHLKGGYVAQSDSPVNHFKNDLISAIDLRSFNDV